MARINRVLILPTNTGGTINYLCESLNKLNIHARVLTFNDHKFSYPSHKVLFKKNENLTSSILIWGALIIFPIAMYYEQPWNLVPRLDSTISLIYLGIFPTGIAWLIRFHILKKNGLVFHSQVAYLIPIFGVILGYVFLKEVITLKVLIALIAVIIGFYFVRRSIKQNLSSN